jgi:chorismate synthase
MRRGGRFAQNLTKSLRKSGIKGDQRKDVEEDFWKILSGATKAQGCGRPAGLKIQQNLKKNLEKGRPRKRF